MKSLSILTVCLAIVGGWNACPRASEWGCKCIICVSNPGGATQFSECVPPIHRLERHLEHGGSFPNCDEAEAAGYTTEHGYQPYYTCEEAYGTGWQMAWKEPESFDERPNRKKKKYCRKVVGYQWVRKSCGDDGRYCWGKIKVPIYETRKMKRRPKPFYIQLVNADGTKAATKVWYRRR